MTLFIHRYIRNVDGATAAEFALVLPILIIFLLGILDIGRFMWTWNMGEKATQMGVRYAIVTDMVPSSLITYSFATGGSGIPAGEVVPQSAFGGATCTSTSCSCLGTCPPLGYSSTAFNNILKRIQAIMPMVTAANLQIDYLYSGLGYSGDPNGPDVAPLVRVRLVNLTPFQPVLFVLFGATIDLPDFSATLPMEDGAGTVGN